MGVFLGHCHVGVGEHLAHSLDTHAFCQRPRRKRVAADVHCQVDVQLGKVGDYLQLVVAFLVAHLSEDRDELLESDPFRKEAIPLYQVITNYLKENDVTFVNI